jgi:hypothetical protein
MKNAFITGIMAATILIAGCSKKSPSSSATPPPASQPAPIFSGLTNTIRTAKQPIAVSEWDKVKISDSGDIFVNKKQMSLADFSAECQRLKQAGGAVLIYTGDMPHLLSPAQTAAVQKLTDAGVQMKMALKESELD